MGSLPCSPVCSDNFPLLLLIMWTLFLTSNSSPSLRNKFCPSPDGFLHGHSCYGLIPESFYIAEYSIDTIIYESYFDAHEHAEWYCQNVWLGGFGGHLASIHSSAELEFVQETLWSRVIATDSLTWSPYAWEPSEGPSSKNASFGPCVWVGLRADKLFLGPSKGECGLKWTDGSPVDFDPFETEEAYEGVLPSWCSWDSIESDERERGYSGCFCLPVGNYSNEVIVSANNLSRSWVPDSCRDSNKVPTKSFVCKRDLSSRNVRLALLSATPYVVMGVIPACFGIAVGVPILVLLGGILIAFCIMWKCPESACKCCRNHGICLWLESDVEGVGSLHPPSSILRNAMRPLSVSLVFVQWLLVLFAFAISVAVLWISQKVLEGPSPGVPSEYSINSYGSRLTAPGKRTYFAPAIVLSVFLVLVFLLPCASCFYLGVVSTITEQDSSGEARKNGPRFRLIGISICFPILWPYFCCCVQFRPQHGWKGGLQEIEERRKARLVELRAKSEGEMQLFYDGKDVKEFRRAVLMARWPTVMLKKQRRATEFPEKLRVRFEAIMDNLELLHDVKLHVRVGLPSSFGGSFGRGRREISIKTEEEEEEGEVVFVHEIEVGGDSFEVEEEEGEVEYELVEYFDFSDKEEEESEGEEDSEMKGRRKKKKREYRGTTFRTFKSFLVLSGDAGAVQNLKHFPINLERVGLRGLVLTEEFLNRFLFGGVPPSELFAEYESMFDLYAIFQSLGLRNHLQYLCHLIDTVRVESPEVVFQIFRACHDRFEDRRSRSQSSSTVTELNCGLTCSFLGRVRALFGRRRRGGGSIPLGEEQSEWLSSVGLSLDTPHRVLAKDLPPLKGKAAALETPEHASNILSTCNIFLADRALFETFAREDYKPLQNMFLQSGIEGSPTLIGAHVEVMFPSYDCFRLMLSFSEREEFEDKRIVVMEFLTTNAIRSLVEFTYTGDLTFRPSEIGRQRNNYPTIGDLFRVLHFADKYDAVALRSRVVFHLKSAQADCPEFLSAVRRDGLVIAEICSSRDEILERWARYSRSEDVTLSTIWQALSRAEFDEERSGFEERLALALFEQVAG